MRLKDVKGGKLEIGNTFPTTPKKLQPIFWRFYPGTLEWYPNPNFGGLTPIYPHFNTILRDF